MCVVEYKNMWEFWLGILLFVFYFVLLTFVIWVETDKKGKRVWFIVYLIILGIICFHFIPCMQAQYGFRDRQKYCQDGGSFVSGCAACRQEDQLVFTP
jgi:RsiW-degrading membrane proteinase PrsW (M82 family)